MIFSWRISITRCRNYGRHTLTSAVSKRRLGRGSTIVLIVRAYTGEFYDLTPLRLKLRMHWHEANSSIGASCLKANPGRHDLMLSYVDRTQAYVDVMVEVAEAGMLTYFQDTTAAALFSMGEFFVKLFPTVHSTYQTTLVRWMSSLWTACNGAAAGNECCVAAFIARFFRHALRNVADELPSTATDPALGTDVVLAPLVSCSVFASVLALTFHRFCSKSMTCFRDSTLSKDSEACRSHSTASIGELLHCFSTRASSTDTAAFTQGLALPRLDRLVVVAHVDNGERGLRRGACEDRFMYQISSLHSVPLATSCPSFPPLFALQFVPLSFHLRQPARCCEERWSAQSTRASQQS